MTARVHAGDPILWETRDRIPATTIRRSLFLCTRECSSWKEYGNALLIGYREQSSCDRLARINVFLGNFGYVLSSIGCE